MPRTPRADLTGRRFGRWTVESAAPDRVGKSGYHQIMWHCVCDCGTRKVVSGKSLLAGDTQSCGCLMRELVGERARRHGGFGSRLYAVWNSMRQRCNNPHHVSYHNYGGRGIEICKEWDDYEVFREWAVNAGYDEDAKRGVLTLDRIDVNLGYSPDNCRFVDMREQADNRRDSILVEYDGKPTPLSVVADKTGTKYCTLWKRYKRNPNSILQ